MTDALTLPLKTKSTKHYKPNKKKKDSDKSIFELWFDSQYYKLQGEQPPLCVTGGTFVEVGRPQRRATTVETLQDSIDRNTDVQKRAKNHNMIEAGDFSDDEEDDEEPSSMHPASPKSESSRPIPPPSPTHTTSMSPTSHSFESATSRDQSQSESSTKKTFSRPTPKGKRGTGRKNRKKFSLDETPVEPLSPSFKNQNSATNFPDSISISENNSDSKNNISNGNINNPNSHNNSPNPPGNNILTQHKTNQQQIYTKLKKGNGNNNFRRNKYKNQNIADLWFKAQSQLKQGKQPKIASDNNIYLDNVRMNVKRYADHAKRSSGLNVAQDFLNVYISAPRKSIAVDDDEDDDLTDNELSTSKSNPNSKQDWAE